MDFSGIFNYLIGSVFLSAFFVISGSKFLNEKLEFKFKNFCIILFLIIFITFNYMILDNVAKLVTLYVFVLFAYKMLFKRNLSQCAIVSLVAYLLLVVSEMLFIFTLTILQAVKVIGNIENYAGGIIANACISILSIIIALIISKKVNDRIDKVKENNKGSLIFIFTVLLLAIGSLLYKMNFNDWKFGYSFVLNGILILSLVCLGFFIIKQHLDKLKIADEYEKYVKYSKETEKLVEQYSICQHENRNELILIRGMVKKSNTKLLEYLDESIGNKDNIENAWIRYLRYLPFGGLKGIIHNKLSNMNDKKINVFFNISKDVSESALGLLNVKENNQLSKIIGVFLDNAIEATKDVENKEISFCIYVQNDKVVFEIANTYKGEVNVDEIYETGNSTKGKGHGYGLALVKAIVNESPIFENETQTLEGYFVQKLIVSKNEE